MSLLKEKYDLLEAYSNVLVKEADESQTPFFDTNKKFNDTTKPLNPRAYMQMMHMAKKSKRVAGPMSDMEDQVSEPENSTEEILQQVAPKIDAINQAHQQQPDQEWKDLDFEDLVKYAPGESEIAAFEATDLPEWGFKDLEPLISRSYITKEPLLIYGDPGIGKSSTVEYFAEHIAAPSKGKVFKDWRRCSIEEKTELINNPSKYFVLITELVNKLEPSDFMGVPMIQSNKPYLETQQLKWIYLMSRPDSDGILFLDEINLGSPQIFQSLYEVVLDKSFAGTKASEDFCIMAAGNIAGAFTSNVDPLPRALVDRFTSGVIIAKPEEWLEYAERAKVDRRIIAFVKSDAKNNFYAKPTGDSDPFPTPRSLVKLSKKLKEIYREYNEYAKTGTRPPTPLYRAIVLEASAKCGVKWANGFVTFLNYIRAFDLTSLTKDIANINKKEQSEMLALTVFLVNKVRFASDKEFQMNPLSKDRPPGDYNVGPETFEVLDAFAHVLAFLDKDPAMTLWTYVKNDLSAQQQAVVLEFMKNGKYDPKAKAKLLQRLPKLLKIAKGEV